MCHLVTTRDVAKLYNSETKIINQVVKRNINRFPNNFCFQLTSEEYVNLKSQIVTSKDIKNTFKSNHVAHGESKTFSINLLEDKLIKNNLLKYIIEMLKK